MIRNKETILLLTDIDATVRKIFKQDKSYEEKLEDCVVTLQKDLRDTQEALEKYLNDKS